MSAAQALEPVVTDVDFIIQRAVKRAIRRLRREELRKLPAERRQLVTRIVLEMALREAMAS